MRDVQSGTAHSVSISNNNGYIKLRYRYKGTIVTISGIGRWDNEESQDKARQLKKYIEDKGLTNTDDVKYILECFNKEDIFLKTLDSLEETVTVNIIRSLYLQYGARIVDRVSAYKFVEFIRERGLKESSVKRYVAECSRINKEWFGSIKVQEEYIEPRPFTKKEVESILQWFWDNDRHYYGYVLFAFNTGCRTSEIIGLKWADIDFNARLIYITHSLARIAGQTNRRENKTTKTRLNRKIPINNKLYDYLSKKDKTTELVFLSKHGKIIDDHNFVNRQWHTCLSQCNIPYRKFNCTRHTFITNFLKETGDVVACAKLTHNSKTGVQTIYRYYAGIVDDIKVPEL